MVSALSMEAWDPTTQEHWNHAGESEQTYGRTALSMGFLVHVGSLISNKHRGWFDLRIGFEDKIEMMEVKKKRIFYRISF